MKAITIKQVAEKISLGQSTIYRMIAAGDFPKPFSLGGNRTAWIEDDVENWLRARAGKPLLAPRDDSSTTQQSAAV